VRGQTNANIGQRCPWSGFVGTSGSVTQTATVAGNFQYFLNCASAIAQVSIDVGPASSGGPPAGGGGHGGGGAMDPLELRLLGILVPTQCARRRRSSSRRICL